MEIAHLADANVILIADIEMGGVLQLSPEHMFYLMITIDLD